MALLSSVGRRLAGMGGGKKTIAALGLTSMAAGFLNKSGEAAISNTMDIAFGTPEADNMMIGQDLTPSLAMGALVPGLAGAPARMINAAKLGMYGTADPYSLMAAPLAGAGIGGLTARTGWWRNKIKNWWRINWVCSRSIWSCLRDKKKIRKKSTTISQLTIL